MLEDRVETDRPAADTPAAAKSIPHEADQVKHKVMAFDLEGLADDGSKNSRALSI